MKLELGSYNTVQKKTILLSLQLHKMFPDWPQGISYKTQKWRYSQTTTPYPGSPGCVVLNDKPLLLFGGDGFTQSNFDGCIDSAEKIADVLKAKL